MKEFSIIFLKNPNAVVYHFSVGSKLVYGVIACVLSGFIALGCLYYSQHQKIIQQQQMIAEQDTAKATLRQEIGLFSDKEERIAFLEDYVEELKESANNSETALKKHIALTKTNIDKLKELHDYICDTLAAECLSNTYDPHHPHQAVSWMELLSHNFQQFDRVLKQFNSRKVTYEEQASLIKQLRLKISEMERELEGNLQLVKAKGQTVDLLSEKIQEVTGIKVVPQKSHGLMKVPGKTGRGGPTLQDRLAIESEDSLIYSGYLRQLMQDTSSYYEDAVRQYEKIAFSIEENRALWRNTPTILPVKSLFISDDFGMRIDPFTAELAFHSGTDFVAQRGAIVYATADGVVHRAKRQSGYGLFIEIRHGQGFHPKKDKMRYATRYAHLSEIKVKKDDNVKRGDVIALAGSTGRSTGPHLHYEIIINGRAADPMTFLSHYVTDNPQFYRRK
ncbi:M23 family metallopeptidase [Deltaproteobacteria bacterium TL4]